jgi:hypothetical protein
VVNLYHRLRRAESRISSRGKASLPRGEDLETVRRAALHENECAKGDPPFVVTDEAVLCAADGKPVITAHQTAAEVAYWLEVEWLAEDLASLAGEDPYLDHDEEEQAFYAPDGKLILSRDYLDLHGLFACLDAAIEAEERGEGDA